MQNGHDKKFAKKCRVLGLVLGITFMVWGYCGETQLFVSLLSPFSRHPEGKKVLWCLLFVIPLYKYRFRIGWILIKLIDIVNKRI